MALEPSGAYAGGCQRAASGRSRRRRRIRARPPRRAAELREHVPAASRPGDRRAPRHSAEPAPQAMRTPLNRAPSGARNARPSRRSRAGARIGPGDRAQQQRDVGDRARHRPRTASGATCRRPGGTRPGDGRKPDDVAEARGIAQRAAHVAAVGDRHHAAGERHGRAAAAAAAGLRQVVRIARRAEHRVERLRAGAELRGVGLADHDRARCANRVRRAHRSSARCRDRCASRTSSGSPRVERSLIAIGSP